MVVRMKLSSALPLHTRLATILFKPYRMASATGLPTPPMVTKLLHTRYRVADLEKTLAFYKDVLGLEEVRRHKSPRGSELVFLKAPKSEETIEICCYPASGPVVVGPDLTHLAFEVPDLDAFAKHAAARGCPLSDGPTTTSTGTVFAFIDAPEGYEIELIQQRH
jgi:lactoylglutathione lyase